MKFIVVRMGEFEEKIRVWVGKDATELITW